MSNDLDNTIIQLENLSRELDKNGNRVIIIDTVSFSFERGKVYNIVGPSGSGKSSLLRLMNRLDESSSGNILFNNKDIKSYPPTEIRKKVNLLFQTPHLFSGSVSDNIEYCCDLSESDNIDSILEKVGLDKSFSGRNADDLSVGQKQRVALARSLVLNPEVLLLDEPTSALDPATSKKIEELILNLSQEFGLTIIIVTHNPDQALRLGGETLLIVDGKLVESGRTDEVLRNPKTGLGLKYINKELL